MDRDYSNLELTEHDQATKSPELVKYDETTRAPERDHDATAFELDSSALAPQVVPDLMPQVLYDRSLPEASGNEEKIEEHAPGNHFLSTKLKWVWMVIALLTAVAIAIGVGVGIWHNREQSSHSPSAPENHSLSPPSQFILNDTSLAAVSLTNGDRQLFFQDNSGHLRCATRTASNSQWSIEANLDLSMNSSPKNHTPMAVVINDIAEIELYYISENHYLNMTGRGSYAWGSDPSWTNNYSTAQFSRSLSVTSIAGQLPFDNSTKNSAILYYENPTGKVSALLKRTFSYTSPYSSSGKDFSELWVDITSQDSKALPDEFRRKAWGNATSGPHSDTLYESFKSNATYGAPFTSGTYQSIVATLFRSPFDPSSGNIANVAYKVGPNGTGNFTEYPILPEIEPDSSISKSDIAIFGKYNAIWINGTQPTLLDGIWGIHGVAGLPESSFPFARLASVTLNDSSATFLYHQINGTAFAEEQWDNTLNVWIPPVYFTVSDP